MLPVVTEGEQFAAKLSIVVAGFRPSEFKPQASGIYWLERYVQHRNSDRSKIF